MKRKLLTMMLLTMISLLVIVSPTYAWSNGGYSISPDNPKYGTHDYILQRAIDMLPFDMKIKIDLTAANYGTEIPDCNSGEYCVGDTIVHHIYYNADKTLQDNSSATRAQTEYDLAKSYLKEGNKYQFSLHLGAMTHYIDDLAVFGHTMGSLSVWGYEIHHSDYEKYVDKHLSLFPTTYDGSLITLSAYDGALKLANETTFDDGIYTNVWMDNNYDWKDSAYVERTKYLMSYSANILTDVIYTLINSTNDTLTGDIDGNDQITASDALLYLRYSVGQDIYPYYIDIGDDVTCDDRITAADSLKVLRKAVGQDVNLEC